MEPSIREEKLVSEAPDVFSRPLARIRCGQRAGRDGARDTVMTGKQEGVREFPHVITEELTREGSRACPRRPWMAAPAGWVTWRQPRFAPVAFNLDSVTVRKTEKERM